MPLTPGEFAFVCVDDSRVARAQYAALLRRLHLEIPSDGVVMGSTPEEAAAVHETVLRYAITHTTVACILDQHLEYEGGEVLGTQITAALRDDGFQGPIFIRSSNGTAEDVEEYERSGATAFISKETTMAELECALVAHLEAL